MPLTQANQNVLVYVNAKYNRTANVEYAKTDDSQYSGTYAYKSYIQGNQSYNIGTITTRTLILGRYIQYQLDSTTVDISCQIIYCTDLDPNTTTYGGTFRVNSTLNNWDAQYWHTFSRNGQIIDQSIGFNIQEAYTTIYNQQINSYDQIGNQINNIYTYIENFWGTPDWDDEGITITNTSPNYSDVFQRNENYMTYTYDSNLIEEAEEIILVKYMYVSTQIENPTQQTLNQYKTTFENVCNSVEAELAYYEAQPDVPQPTIEVVDIAGLLWQILGMPFAWISTAFNLTLFPGTQYSINIAALFMEIIGVLILIFILKKMLK